ncbi:MAG: universal stress protein [Desulfobacteraceae bacterium]|nr:universal stress protein [Desulfobacteraceae bacterium]MBC2754688.1 universal stress protein [Desulfobacteraceae bacterium]
MVKQKLKILIPVDGSEQALHAAVYAAKMFPNDRSEMVLFHVDAQNPDLGKSISGNPLYDAQMKNIDKWMAADHKVMNQFMDKAVDRILDLDYPESAVSVKIKKKEDRVLDEIIREARDEYDAVVVGKTGKSRLKDKFIGSLAIKLAGKMNLIPLIIVDGAPGTDKLLLSVDRREEAFKSIYSIGALLDIQNFSIAICHVARCAAKKIESADDFEYNSTEHDCPLRDVECICPSIGSMKECLIDSGILSSKITDLVVSGANPVSSTLELTQAKQFGSIIVGRRAFVPFVEEVISGRYSQKMLKKMENVALWVVN